MVCGSILAILESLAVVPALFGVGKLVKKEEPRVSWHQENRALQSRCSRRPENQVYGAYNVALDSLTLLLTAVPGKYPVY